MSLGKRESLKILLFHDPVLRILSFSSKFLVEETPIDLEVEEGQGVFQEQDRATENSQAIVVWNNNAVRENLEMLAIREVKTATEIGHCSVIIQYNKAPMGRRKQMEDAENGTESSEEEILRSRKKTSGIKMSKSKQPRTIKKRRRSSTPTESDSSSSGTEDERNRRKKRKITEKEIKEYMIKKAKKKVNRVAKKMKARHGHDAHVWGKKIERDISQVLVGKFSYRAARKKQKEIDAEIEKGEKMKKEREIEKARCEDEIALLARERARAEFQDWEKKEEEFYFDQSKKRSEIRLRQGRANLLIFSPNWATPTHIWEAALVVCDWELAEAQKRYALDRARLRAERRRFYPSIEAEMHSGTALADCWEAHLKRLHIYKAKACLKEIHNKHLRGHLHRLEHPLERKRYSESDYESKTTAEETFDDLENDRPYSPVSFSPELLHGAENEEAIYPEVDRIELEQKRVIVLGNQKRRLQKALASKPTPPEDNMDLKAMKGMGAMEKGDALFGSGTEANMESHVYWWHDQYRPRKPKYFNRVHTGYEWNKHNQTHYDHDNPPPSMVQGYKFNIFYPDLVDKSKAPEVILEKDGCNNQTCVIRFHAVPPYEDIAFRIVNKYWEYSRKKGFKCTFESGILHVNVSRYRYRR
ncbi:hypothetical protein IFM89_029270 [Coptis chinensis]|uniref:Splicing factor Cactin n=1 Tax=Coptis chinensis TaxID=261450 RepID=A0A835HYP6_9MAGN|nr:hypothetical protein IFM89_029270 [Coptis chinensis]